MAPPVASPAPTTSATGRADAAAMPSLLVVHELVGGGQELAACAPQLAVVVEVSASEALAAHLREHVAGAGLRQLRRRAMEVPGQRDGAQRRLLRAAQP